MTVHSADDLESLDDRIVELLKQGTVDSAADSKTLGLAIEQARLAHNHTRMHKREDRRMHVRTDSHTRSCAHTRTRTHALVHACMRVRVPRTRACGRAGWIASVGIGSRHNPRRVECMLLAPVRGVCMCGRTF